MSAAPAGAAALLLAPALVLGSVGICAGAGAAGPGPATYRYEVLAGPGAAELRVEARLPAGHGAFSFGDGYGRFASELALEEGGRLRPLALDGDVVRLDCGKSGCRLRYRFALAEAAAQRRSRGGAFEQGGALLAPPTTWLPRPLDPPQGSRYRLAVRTPPGIRFVTGLFPAEDGADEYEADADDLVHAPHSGFGPFELVRITVTGGVVELALAPGERRLSSQEIAAWVEAAAGHVVLYYGRYPVKRALVIALPGGRRAVGYGTSMGNGGASILVSLGREATPAELDRDWVLTHEMVHLAHPNLPLRQHWMEEGLATYVEPVARTRAGRQTPEQMWRELVTGLPRGARALAEHGLDRDGSWAGTYWGGALFFFLADVAIRERTLNRRSLDDALRAVAQAGGTLAVSWPLERILRVGDDAVGLRVLQDLHAEMGESPRTVDLSEHWRRLGVAVSGERLEFDEGAPLAAVRRAITAAPANAGAAAPGSAAR